MQEGHLFVWNASTGALEAKLKEHEAAVSAVAWSPTGRQCASVDKSGVVVVWDG